MASNDRLVSLNNLKRFLNYLRTGFTAPKSKCDALGNVIDETYLQKKDLSGGSTGKGGSIAYVDEKGKLGVGDEIELIKKPAKEGDPEKKATLKFDGDYLISNVPIKADVENSGSSSSGSGSSGNGTVLSSSVKWKDIKDKPDAFPPLMHTHDDYVKKSELSLKNGDITLDVLGLRVQKTLIIPTSDNGQGNFWIT